MDSSTGNVAPMSGPVGPGLIQGPPLWWASRPAAVEETLANPQMREAESAARPGLVRPDPWR